MLVHPDFTLSACAQAICWLDHQKSEYATYRVPSRTGNFLICEHVLAIATVSLTHARGSPLAAVGTIGTVFLRSGTEQSPVSQHSESFLHAAQHRYVYQSVHYEYS